MPFIYDDCPICNSRANITEQSSAFNLIDCQRCSEFRISKLATRTISDLELSDRQITNFSSWLRQNPGTTVRDENIEFLVNVKAPSYGERAELTLRFLAEVSDHEGDEFGFDEGASVTELQSVAWCCNFDELQLLLRSYMAEEKGWIKFKGSSWAGLPLFHVSVTPRGYDFLDSIRHSTSIEPIGFCAMWFDQQVDAVWTDSIAPAIEASGYRSVRIDKVEHTNRIDDEIMAQIRRSRFIVADFTGNRGGVYFEAGFAAGLGIPVIWTIRSDQLNDVHFDNRQYNFILWDHDDLDTFKTSLANRIQAVIGIGPLQNTAPKK